MAVDRAQEALMGLLENLDRKGGCEQTAFILLFGMGRECFYAWRGDMDIRALSLQFGKGQVRGLTRRVEGIGCGRAVLEENVGLILGARTFLDSLSGEMVFSCLNAIDLNGQQQADRHLAELCQEAGRRGAGDRTAILFIVKGGIRDDGLDTGRADWAGRFRKGLPGTECQDGWDVCM